MEPKISIIVPIYNVEKYINKCIDSILAQTFTDFELILVDDGSPDNCGKICDDYAKKDSRIKVIHKKNGGLSSARNAGLDIARGEYIGFIDSDDYIHEEFYETLMNLIIKYDADIAQCEFLRVYEEENTNVQNIRFHSNKTIITLNNIEALNNLYNENSVNAVVVWNKLYKKELFNEIRFPKEKIHEDEYTTYQLLFNAKRIVLTSEQMYYYLQRTNSIMGKGFNIKRLDALEAYYGQVMFYNKKKLYDLENKAKIRFESLIRINMSRVLKSSVDNSDRLFNDLIKYYKNNYDLFNNNLDVSFKKKVIMILFRYSPNYIVKLLCNLMYWKSKLV
ncbi:glycosyltransferase [Clostridium thermopalmarium]|uniref:Putative glycosyltransferase EpsJ n=1 Tax=Clostridium thermopalmarium DSM 5974 TaxID=1121340 RepID=A0A2T0AZ72_9CLOT|nr:glycosyltransferase [Clostridium thermopalmarium]PRR76504.1 putative glycosyltransferase EpsJ [Clostridium thermopalmarium DSM 5974]PVZ28383.1 glycosyltransferase involved in cell wall biosynthesis [Clostridium thermopalmarium DSM 5974]